MFKFVRIGNSLAKSLSVFDVAGVGANSGVKNVFQSMFSQKNTGDDSHAFGILVMAPKTPQVCDGVNRPFFLFQFEQELIIVDVVMFCEDFNVWSVFLDKGYDSFAVVFGYIFCLVFHFFDTFIG